MQPVRTIRRPDDPTLDELCSKLAELADALDAEDAWPRQQLQLCGQYGVFEWFVAPELGGQGWSDADVVQGYLRLSSACLTTTFEITQRTGACRRIAVADNAWAREQCLPSLIEGRRFATVGISHLTTSRQHLGRPVLAATISDDAVILDGYSPWVTGAAHADWIVTGASTDQGLQVLVAVPTDLPGVKVEPPVKLVGVSASQTGAVRFERASIPSHWLLAGPGRDIMKQGIGAKSGGLQTSTLATGLSDAAIRFLEAERDRRSELSAATDRLRDTWNRLRDDLLSAADGQPVCSNEELRTRANSLALRASQAALAAAKGAGYVVGHPAGRWCREALFFLVWSCPQPVMSANLCEFAGLGELGE
jgi:alkylation response protein AidB-like acyl-CoA dehydrogenase